MDPTIIIIDSDDEDNANQNTEEKQNNKLQAMSSNKRPNSSTNGSNEANLPVKIRRIQPQKIGEVNKTETSSSNGEDQNNKDLELSQEANDTQENKDVPSKEKERQENEITKELKGFIKACRQIEPNDDMKKIIKSKLLKYYHLVHPEYAVSKFLRKMLEDSALAVLKDPRSVYSRLQDIINELKSRKKLNAIASFNIEENESKTSQEAENGIEIKGTGDEKRDQQLRKLNKGLAKLRQRIEALEEEEVDWDNDDDSAYMRKVNCEKRAVEIYKKICEITGESTHAHRTVKQPVTFKNSDYKEFNKKLTKKINKENGFPSYYDVYRLLDFCNKEYKYQLKKEQVKSIAMHAFEEVGKLLQQRRKSDLYESATYWAGKARDPAKDDSELKSKLEKNRQYYQKKTEEILETFVKKQLNGDLGCNDDDDGEKEDDDDDNDSEVKMGEASTSRDSLNCDTTVKEEEHLKCIPTKQIVSIIDVKAEQLVPENDFEMLNGDDKKLEDSKIDVSLSI